MTGARVAALYDVHGNHPALEAVLAEVDAVAPDALVVVGGDFAPGPLPRETLAALRALGNRALFISGNGERELLEGREAPEDAWAARRDFVAATLPAADLDFLRALPATVSVDVAGLGATLFCHGSPRSDLDIVTELTPDVRLRPMLVGVSERVVVLGHTHSQWDRTVDRFRVVNAGSVGMPYEDAPGAYWALLGPAVELRRTPYDLDAAAGRIRSTGFPDAEEFVAEFVLAVTSREEATAYFERVAGDGGG